MHPIYNAKQAQAIDDHTINNTGLPSLVLMERASLAVTKRVLLKLEGDKERPVICVCGKGNNGGDGLCCARQLKEAGVNVKAFLAGGAFGIKPDKKKNDFEAQLYICINSGVELLKSLKIPDNAIVVDAIFGNGLDRDISGEYTAIIKKINSSGAYVISVDIPSGISASTGRVLGTAVKADETVTFGGERLGHILFPGADLCGKIIRADIGWNYALHLPENKENPFKNRYFLLDERELEIKEPRKKDTHKGSFGNVLIVAGSKLYGGAPVLCALAAFKSGAGLVRVFTHEDNKAAILSVVPEAICYDYERSDFKSGKAGELLDELKVMVKSSDAVLVGPGIGTEPCAREILSCVLEYAKAPLVIDADALNIISEDEGDFSLSKGFRSAEVVITPHIKEAARLLKKETQEVKADLPGAALELQKKYGCMVVLKSAVTVIAIGDNLYFNNSGNPGMAAAGSGDVLAGIIASLAAQGLRGEGLLALSVYLHSQAGNKARESFGEYAVRASDIASAVGDVLK